MAVQLTPPVLITFVNNGGETCLQAEAAASGAAVNLQAIDYTFKIPNQFWQFGDDNRIYLFNPTAEGNNPYCLTFQPPAGDGQSLIIHDYDATDANQTWDWNSAPPTIINLGATTSETTYVIDDLYGRTGNGNKVQIWEYNEGSGNQPWAAQLVLRNYFQTDSISKPLVSGQTV